MNKFLIHSSSIVNSSTFFFSKLNSYTKITIHLAKLSWIDLVTFPLKAHCVLTQVRGRMKKKKRDKEMQNLYSFFRHIIMDSYMYSIYAIKTRAQCDPMHSPSFFCLSWNFCYIEMPPTIAFSRQIFKTFSFFYVVTVQSPRFGLPVDLIMGGLSSPRVKDR